jgi:hypothetical protein
MRLRALTCGVLVCLWAWLLATPIAEAKTERHVVLCPTAGVPDEPPERVIPAEPDTR